MPITPVKMFGTLTEADCINIQQTLAAQIQQKNRLPLAEMKTIGGVDLAYWHNGAAEYAVCCIVILDIASGAILETAYADGPVTFPYIPGCLAFRELPLVVEAAEKLHFQPDVYMFDGNGLLHPRHLGLAAHASFYLDRPALGVAKTYFKVDGAEFIMPENKAQAFTDITIGHSVWGRAVRTHQNVKPIFLSVGNYLDLDTATSLTLSLVDDRSHIPLPTRYADLETHKMRALLK